MVGYPSDSLASCLYCGPSENCPIRPIYISLNVRISLQHRQNHTHYDHSHCFCNTLLLVMFLSQSQFSVLSSTHRHSPPPAKCIQRHTIAVCSRQCLQQESPAIADKPARRESLPKIAPIRRAYNVVADNTGLSSCV